MEINKLPKCETCGKNAQVVIDKDNMVSIVCKVDKTHATRKCEIYQQAYDEWCDTWGKE